MSKKQKNLVWILGFSFLFALCFIFWLLWGKEGGQTAVIFQDGKELYRIPLVQERIITIDAQDGGKNVVQISPQGVSVIEADCPDGRCKRQGVVSKAGVPIVCLPHRLTVEIEGGRDVETKWQQTAGGLGLFAGVILDFIYY